MTRSTIPRKLEEPAEVAADSREHGVDRVASTMGEEVPAHAVILLGVADDGFDPSPPSELVFDRLGHAAFWPWVYTLNLCAWGALWPLYPASARMRDSMAPVSASIAGCTVFSV